MTRECTLRSRQRFAKPVIVGERMRGTVGSLSGNCTSVHVRTVQACAEVGALRNERAVAVQGFLLEIEAKQ